MTTDLLKPKGRDALQVTTDLCATGVILLAGLALLGWLSGERSLTSVLVDYIPMAVSTAVSFIVVASLLLGRRHPWAIRHNSFLAAITALLAILYFVNLLGYSISNGTMTVDALLFPTNETVQSFTVNRMSPITGATFLVSALALYFLFRAQANGNTAHGAALLGSIVFVVGSISGIGYLYGTPLLYSGPVIPLALTTALAFTLLGIGLVAATGANNFILHPFSGTLLRARLLRTFLPTSVLVILTQGYFHWRFIPGGINPALWDAWTSLVFATLMSVAIDLTSRVVAQAADRAQMERQRVEESLRESEARYRVLVDASPDSIVLSDLTGKILRCNPQTFRSLGYEHESDLIGKRVIELVIPEDRERAIQNVRAAIRSGVGENNEYTATKVDGTQFAVEVRSAVIVDSLGQPSSMISLIRDVTQRHQAERSLRESQAQLEGIVSSAMDAIITIDDDQRIVIFNPAAKTMFGCSSSDVIGQTLDRFIPEKVRQDHKTYIRTFGKSDSTKRTMKTPTLALTCLRADGEAFPGEISISHLMIGGRNLYTAIIRDISERKKSELALQQAEAKYRNIFENAMEGIFQTSPEGKFLTANPALARMLGYESPEELIANVGDLDHDFYVQPDRREEFKRHLNDYGFTFQFESEAYCKDGSTLWISENVQTVRDELWQVHHYEGTLIDITERKRAEEALQRQTKELTAIYESARRLQQLRAPDVLAREIILSLERILNYTFGTVLLIEDTTGRLLPFAISEQRRGGSFTDIDADFIASHEPRVGKGITGWVAQTGEAVCVGDVSKDSRYYAIRQDIQSELCVPLQVNDQIIGVVNVESIRQNAYGESDQRVLETIAAQIATAIQNSRLYDQVQQELAERKKAEDALRENQSRLQLIMDRMPIACILYDTDFRITYWNQAAERIFGYTAEEIIGKVENEFLVPPSLWSRIDAVDRQIISGNMDVNSANENLTKDGRVIFCEWSNTPLKDEQGNVVAVLGMAQDVTERKKAEEQLRKLSLAVEQSPVSIVITNTGGEIEYVNPKFKDVTGYSADEIIGQNPRILKSGHTSAEEYQTLWKTISEGKEWRGKFLNKKKNGELYWEAASLSPIVNETGEITHYLAVKEDITEREHREQELEAIAALSLALRAAPTRKEMLSIIIDQLHSLLHSDSEAISIRDPLTDELVVELGRGTFATAAGVRVASDQGVTGLVIRSGKPYLSNDAQHDPNFMLKNILQGINAFACVPLSTHDATLGILWIGRATGIIASEVRVLVAIADIAANAMQRATLHEQTTKQLQRLTALRTIDNGISNSFDMRVTLNIFIEQVLTQLNVHAASILISKDILSLEYAAGSGFRNRGIAKSRLRIGESHAGRAALERRMVSIPDLSKDPFTSSDILPAEGFVSYYGVPLIAKGQLKGVLQIFHRAPLSPDEEWLDFLQTLAGQAAIAMDNAAMFDNLQRANSELLVAYNATIEGWSRALDLRDQETEGHTQRVTEMALNLAAMMGVEEVELVHVRRGALLHDIGKMGVPDSILLKPGPLSEQEMEIMRRHPQYAYDMLSPIPFLRPALDIPYCHHEKWDGTGYPRRLKGEQIPLVARIFAVVDVWDAITSDRPYRTAWSHDKARNYIREQSGLYFEPRVVETFLEMISLPDTFRLKSE